MADLTRDAILALPAGPELDALVAERVLGAVECDEWMLQEIGVTGPIYYLPEPGCGHALCRPRGFVPSYSTNIAAAWAVVEHMKAAGWHPLVGYCDQPHDPPMPEVQFVHDSGGRGGFVCCDHNRCGTMPHAICVAALLAKLGLDEEGAPLG